jgi:hypothetical protein
VKGDLELVPVELRSTEEASQVGGLPSVHPRGFKPRLARGVVLHHEPGGGAIPNVLGGTPCEEGELDGAPYSREGARGGPREGAAGPFCKGEP